MRRALIALFALISTGEVLAANKLSDPSEYVRFTIADSAGVGVSAISRLSIDMKEGKVSTGHGGMLLEPCDEKWNCIDLEFFLFAMPKQCEEIQQGRWKYKGLTFKADSLDDSRRKNRYVIEIYRDKLEGIAIYSQDRGIEAFAIYDSSPQINGLVDYHLVSNKGILADGCPL